MIRGWSWLRSGREHWSWQVVEQTRRRRRTRRTRRRTRRAGNWHKRGKTQQQSWPTRPPQATAKNTTAELAHTAAPNISKKHNSRAGRHGRPKQQQITLLCAIPTMRCQDVYLFGLIFDIWHSTWHIFWYIFWHSIWYFTWHIFRHMSSYVHAPMVNPSQSKLFSASWPGIHWIHQSSSELQFHLNLDGSWILFLGFAQILTGHFLEIQGKT